MAHTVLQLLGERGLLNAQQLEGLKPELGDGYKSSWKALAATFKDYVKRAPEGKETVFAEDADLCSATRAKREFRIEQDELRVLNFEVRYVRKARGYFKFYLTSDVRALAVRKYSPMGVSDIKEAREAKKNRKEALQAERLEVIKQCVPEDALAHVQQMRICADFISNGKGVRNLRERLQRVMEIYQAMKGAFPGRSTSECYDMAIGFSSSAFSIENILARQRIIDAMPLRTNQVTRLNLSRDGKDLVDREIRQYIDSAIGSPDSIAAAAQTRLERKRRLEEEINVRSDSELCRQYIMGEREDFDHVVTTMREMAWYYASTNYASILRDYYDDFYYYRRRDEEEYVEIDRHAASEECKWRAIRDYRRRHGTEGIPESIKRRWNI